MSGALSECGPDKCGGTFSTIAPAKINLFLHVVGRREDGRHELESIFAFADNGDRVGDGLRLTRSDEFSLTLSGPFADDLDDDTNLVMKAAQMLANEVGEKAFPVRMELEKNLPVAAGVGGGSADAAAALHGLVILWDVELPPNRLHSLALQLGADVPACLEGSMVRVTGTGEIVERCSASQGRLHAVLVNPGVRLSTASIFDRYRASNAAFTAPLGQWPDRSPDDEGILEALRGCRNDLSGAAMAEAPVVADVLAELERQQDCQLARMSGSGATCFGLFGDQDGAQQAALSLGNDYPDWWITATELR